MQPIQLPPPRPLGGAGPVTGPEEPAFQEISIHLEPPDPKRLLRLESEAMFRERLRQESKKKQTTSELQFPPEPVLTTQKYRGRNWPPLHMLVEPNYVGFNRLYFHQINFERYGWDLGPVASLLSAGAFFWDLALLPYHQFSDPLRVYEYNAGWCYPGDPTPLLLYPPTVSTTGLIGQAATLALVLVVFP